MIRLALRVLRYALAIPSPSRLCSGDLGRTELRYARLRARGKVPEAFGGADLFLWGWNAADYAPPARAGFRWGHR